MKAGNLIRGWMEDAGLRTLAFYLIPLCELCCFHGSSTLLVPMMMSRWVDYLGNVHGRVEGRNASAEALIIGSHLVTLRVFPNILCIDLNNYTCMA